MKRKIIVCILMLMFALCLVSFCSANAEKADMPLEVAEPVTYTLNPIEIIPQEIEAEPIFTVEKLDSFSDENLYDYTIDQLKMLIDNAILTQENAHKVASASRALGWPEDSNSIRMAKNEWHNADLMIDVYQARVDEIYEEMGLISLEIKMAEYPEATTVWVYMKKLGWNDYVCAGIMGNLMAECGGQTLALQPTIYNPSKYFYGMCQWSKEYYGEIHGADLETQCNFLRDTIQFEIDTFGYAYKKNFNFEAFLELTNEQDAAKAFAQTYERCADWTYGVRQRCATMAYDYFVNN